MTMAQHAGSRGVPITFLPRAEILEPVAVAGAGPVARALARRLLRYDDDRLRRCSGIASTDILIALGEPDQLPWVDGVSYLGRDPLAPRLLLPTMSCPAEVSTDAFERSLLACHAELAPPIAVLT